MPTYGPSARATLRTELQPKTTNGFGRQSIPAKLGVMEIMELCIRKIFWMQRMFKDKVKMVSDVLHHALEMAVFVECPF